MIRRTVFLSLVSISITVGCGKDKKDNNAPAPTEQKNEKNPEIEGDKLVEASADTAATKPAELVPSTEAPKPAEPIPSIETKPSTDNPPVATNPIAAQLAADWQSCVSMSELPFSVKQTYSFKPDGKLVIIKEFFKDQACSNKIMETDVKKLSKTLHAKYPRQVSDDLAFLMGTMAEGNVEEGTYELGSEIEAGLHEIDIHSSLYEKTYYRAVKVEGDILSLTQGCPAQPKKGKCAIGTGLTPEERSSSLSAIMVFTRVKGSDSSN